MNDPVQDSGTVIDFSQRLALIKMQGQLDSLQVDVEALKGGEGGGTSDGMDRVWAKLEEHDRALTSIDERLKTVVSELSNAKYWFVGTALAIAIGGLGLVYAAMQDTKATMGTALTAIQTVVAVKPAEASAPAQPTIIVVPSPNYASPIAPKADQPTK